jgi:hypothetical protein
LELLNETFIRFRGNIRREVGWEFTEVLGKESIKGPGEREGKVTYPLNSLT